MAVASRKHGDVHQLTVLMAEETGRSHKLCVATPCMRSIVNGLNKVWLDRATTREPRHLRRRWAFCDAASANLFTHTWSAGLRNQGQGYKRRGTRRKRPNRSHGVSNMKRDRNEGR